MNFATRLRNIRIEKNMTQDELATKSGVSLKTISRYEIGETFPRSRKYYDKLAEALGVTDTELMSPEDKFVMNIKDDFGVRDANNAQNLVEGMIGLMAGGEMPDEDKKAILDAIQEAYYMSKDENKKYTPKKYRK